ncbi:MAG TPA: uridine kinase [Elusimicrobiota bacterium]|jgi:uridine kinase|nr:uridine kinase [Elusimicrobiota bacterium]
MKADCVVGLSGGTGSGKSWLSNVLQNEFGEDCVILCQDWYYRDNKHLNEQESLKLNFDHPSAIETSLFVRDADRLARGETIEAPVYDYALHGRTGVRTVKPAKVLVLEGLFVLHEPTVRRRLDLSVYIHAADDLRLLRRLRRDCRERRVDLEETLRIYENCVLPMHGKYVAPSSKHATWVWDQEKDKKLPARLLKSVRARLASASPKPARVLARS